MTTYGEKAVELGFNPRGNNTVEMIKKLYVEIIDLCAKGRAEAVDPQSRRNSSEAARLFSVAITEAQTAQMWAVKAVTWED